MVGLFGSYNSNHRRTKPTEALVHFILCKQAFRERGEYCGCEIVLADAQIWPIENRPAGHPARRLKV